MIHDYSARMVNQSHVGVATVQDAVFPNDSSLTTDWSPIHLGCSTWKLPNHPLFQVAQTLLLLGLMSPHWKHGTLFLHIMFVLGFMFLCIWAWVILCAPDYFSWNFAFMVINIIQVLILFYDFKPIQFDPCLEKLYTTVFQPMNITRRLFKKLTDENYCIIASLYEGDAYAVQNITKTDRLGMLLSGTMMVYSNQNVLHHIHGSEFIDSPEFESSISGDEKFQVSIYAASACKYLYWPRQSLEYLLTKEPFLATVLNTIMGRDITNKLYALNNRAKNLEQSPSHEDIRLTPKVKARHSRRSCDLRRTLAQVTSQSGFPSRLAPISDLPDMNNLLLEEESADIEGPYSALEEELELMTRARSSVRSNHSGLHFTIQCT